MKSAVPRVGKRVGVREDHRIASLRMREGAIAKRWGNPGYAALDVLLDDCSLRLVWYHELEQVEEDDGEARSRSEVIAGPKTGGQARIAEVLTCYTDATEPPSMR
jgi:hypothetical protein